MSDPIMSDPTVQTPTAPAPDATGTITVSLAEIDAMGRKAARGAGYSWGMAEEAGRAARWLAAYRLPGPQRLADLLDVCEGAVRSHAPDTVWHAATETLCGLSCGAAISDHADDIKAGTTFDLTAVAEPLMILPFLCRVARDLDFTIALDAGDVRVVATPVGPMWDGDADPDFPAESAVSVRREDGGTGEPRRHVPDGYPLPVAVWRALGDYAQRTYVPASEESRMSGAGAGMTDND